MNSRDIAQLRLSSQQLTGTPYTSPQQVVKWMGCIQAQDYGMAKWAIGSRLQHSTAAAVENDFNKGKILRTHVLRPTWHFICPEDIHWMLRLSAPKIKNLALPYHRQTGIDAAILKKSKKIIIKELDQHKKLTRPQLTAALQKEKIDTSDIRITYLLLDAELDALICSAGRIGKQFAYKLLDQPTPAARSLTNEEAIIELARIYFLSRGPASAQDFAWWAGLTLTEARKGLEENKNLLQSISAPHTPITTTYLLPAFDEYAVAYKYRDDILDPKHASACFYGLKPIVVHNTRITGTWQRAEKKGKVQVTITPFPGTKPVPARALETATKKYLAFAGK